MSILPFKTEYSGGYASVPTAGFVSLSSAILRCAEPPASALDGDPQTDALARWLAHAEDELWPGVLDALASGELQAYGVLPGKGRLPIDKGFWSFIESERMPKEIQWLHSQKSVPWVRIGDLEWLAPFQPMRARWTTDQAIIWLCARDIHPVGLASPLRREARLTWPGFSLQVPFRVMHRLDAMRKLKADILSERLKGLSGSRPLDVGRLDGAEWHRVLRDDLAYWTLRDTTGQLHGFVLDPAEVMALYPAISEMKASAEPEPEPEPEVASTVGSETRCTRWLIAQMEAHSKRKPQSKRVYQEQAASEFGVGVRPFLRCWEKALAQVQPEGWDTAGRPSKAIP